MSLRKAEAIFWNILNHVIYKLLWHYTSKLQSSSSPLLLTLSNLKKKKNNNKAHWLDYIYEGKLVNLLLIKSPAENSLVSEES